MSCVFHICQVILKLEESQLPESSQLTQCHIESEKLLIFAISFVNTICDRVVSGARKKTSLRSCALSSNCDSCAEVQSSSSTTSTSVTSSALYIILFFQHLICFRFTITCIFRLKLFLEQFGISSCVLNSELPANSRYVA